MRLTFTKPGLRAALNLLAAISLGLTGLGTGFSGVLEAQSGSVSIFLDPSRIDLKPGETTPVLLKVDASSQPLDTVQVFLDFDPTLLQVVDDAGAAAATVTFGPVIRQREWQQVLLNEVDNGAGRIGVAAGKGPPASGAPDLAREFVLAIIHFKAVGADADAVVSIDQEEQESRLRTKAFSRGIEVTGESAGAVITIAAVAAAPASTPSATARPGISIETASGSDVEAAPAPAVTPQPPGQAAANAEAAPAGGSSNTPGTAMLAGIIGGAIAVGLALLGMVVFLRGRRSQGLGGMAGPSR